MRQTNFWQRAALGGLSAVAALLALSVNYLPSWDVAPQVNAQSEQQLYPGWNVGVWHAADCVAPQDAFSALAEQGVFNTAGKFLPESQSWLVFDADAPESVNTLQSICSSDALWLHVSSNATWSQSSEPPPEPGGDVNQEGWDVFWLINNYRVASSQCYDVLSQTWQSWPASPQLALSPALTKASHDYAQLMADTGWFSHTGPNGGGFGSRIAAAGYSGFSWAGEIIAAGQTSAEIAFGDWQASDGHNRVMLSCAASAVGVGYAVGGYGARWVADFGNHIDDDLAR